MHLIKIRLYLVINIIKLLQNDEVIPIYDTKSLNEFLKKVDNFYKYQNTNQKLQIYENTQQIKFKFLN